MIFSFSTRELIIWDRLFGTFASEFSSEEKIQYGLVMPVKSFDPIVIQLKYYQAVFKKFMKARGFREKFRALFYGPGYTRKFPGERLGRREGSFVII